MMAIERWQDRTVKLLIDSGARVNAADNNLWTALMYAAREGNKNVVELLIGVGAHVNEASADKQTALIIAAQSGNDTVVQALLKHGAFINATNDKYQTALMLAASEGYMDVVRALLDEGASVEEKSENGESAMMYAIDSNHRKVVHELMKMDNELSHTMALLKLGLQKRRHDAAAKKKPDNDAGADMQLTDLTQLCSKMHEARAISERIYFRLVDTEKQLSTLNEFSNQEAVPRFKQLVSKTHGFMEKYANKHTITRLVASQVIINTSRDINRELDAFLLQFNIQSNDVDIHGWKSKFDEDSIVMKLLLNDSLKQNRVLTKELQDPQVQKEALTLLMFECANHSSQYSDEDMKLINRIFKYVSSMSRLKVDSVPQWFVPPHEVQFDSASSFARGSYGSVHRGTWYGTAVVIKCAFLEDQKSRELFLNETEIWIELQHPHVVTLFRACHVGNPFFVCDWASNGTLTDYLCRDNIRFETWAKLHEAAMGLKYLHTKMKFVHGDLKCNNILIGTDKKAKLTDFGLSFKLISKQKVPCPPREVGAINWKAPEVISGKTRGTFASDVYSFGMCIVEAVTERMPWGIMPDVAVKYKAVTQKALPKQPVEMNDEQWKLVKLMCAWHPKDRINISKAVKILGRLVNEEFYLKTEVLWAEHKAKQPASEPEPVSLVT